MVGVNKNPFSQRMNCGRFDLNGQTSGKKFQKINLKVINNQMKKARPCERGGGGGEAVRGGGRL